MADGPGCLFCGTKTVEVSKVLFKDAEIYVCRDCEPVYTAVLGRQAEKVVGKRNTDPEYIQLFKLYVNDLEANFIKLVKYGVSDAKVLWWRIYSHTFNKAWVASLNDPLLEDFKTGVPSLREIFGLWQSKTRLLELLSKPWYSRSNTKLAAEKRYYKKLKEGIYREFKV